MASKKSNQPKFFPMKIYKSEADFNPINNLDLNDRLVYQTINAKPKYKQLIKLKNSNNRILTQGLLNQINKKYKQQIEIKNQNDYEFIDHFNKENKSTYYAFLLYNRVTIC